MQKTFTLHCSDGGTVKDQNTATSSAPHAFTKACKMQYCVEPAGKSSLLLKEARIVLHVLFIISLYKSAVCVRVCDSVSELVYVYMKLQT